MPSIETQRLILRGWRDEDVEPWADMNADPRVMEFFLAPLERERSYAYAEVMREELERNGYGWFVMEVKGEPGFAGVIAVDEIHYEVPFEPPREIGWRLPAHRWGKGYATEAARALMRFAFETLQWPEIIAMTAAINMRSRRIMEKLGMTYDPREDFRHPRLPADHRLQPHVLYRARAHHE